MDLSKYDNSEFDRGKPVFVEVIWRLVQSFFVSTSIPGSKLRIFILTLFGAKIGKNVVMKPGIKVTFPWKLEIQENSWIGENAWLDNLAFIRIGKNCCISQAVYLCTGNHDWSKNSFDLQLGEIFLEDQVWVGARSSIGPGVRLSRGSIVTLGSALYSNTTPFGIYGGVPAQHIKDRKKFNE